MFQESKNASPACTWRVAEKIEQRAFQVQWRIEMAAAPNSSVLHHITSDSVVTACDN